MSDLVKNVMVRVLIEMNKRVGIQVSREVEETAENDIKESLKELVYNFLVKDGESSEEEATSASSFQGL